MAQAHLRERAETGMEWRVDKSPVSYARAIDFMEEKVDKIRRLGEPDLIWLLQHPPLYTAGTSANPEDLLEASFPVYKTGRGGQYTYHGPGQRIAYVMMDLQKRGSDLRRYIHDLEEWLIVTLKVLGVKGERRPGRIGIWVRTKDGEVKVAAIGVRVRKWVAYHGISINLNPDLSHYGGIVPCGIKDYGVTSLEALGVNVTMDRLDQALRHSWSQVFDRP